MLAIAVFCFDSPLAIATVELVTLWIGWFVNSFPNKKLIGYSYKEQILDIFPILFMALGMCGVVLMIGEWCQAVGMITALIIPIQIVVGVAVYLLLSIFVKPAPYQVVIEIVSGFLKRNADRCA